MTCKVPGNPQERNAVLAVHTISYVSKRASVFSSYENSFEMASSVSANCFSSTASWAQSDSAASLWQCPRS